MHQASAIIATIIIPVVIISIGTSTILVVVTSTLVASVLAPITIALLLPASRFESGVEL